MIFSDFRIAPLVFPGCSWDAVLALLLVENFQECVRLCHALVVKSCSTVKHPVRMQHIKHMDPQNSKPSQHGKCILQLGSSAIKLCEPNTKTNWLQIWETAVELLGVSFFQGTPKWLSSGFPFKTTKPGVRWSPPSLANSPPDSHALPAAELRSAGGG